MGFVPNAPAGHHRTPLRCPGCATAQRQMVDRRRKKQTPQEGQTKSARVSLKICRLKNKRLSNKVGILKAKMQDLQEKCSLSSESLLLEKIPGLPESQQEGVRACFAASKVKNPKSRRYILSWVYECLLLRIKSRKAYDHMRRHNILTLPSPNTLNRYISSVKGAYGLQEAILQCMKEKSKGFALEEGRVVLLLDEMKLSKAVSFDKNTLTVEGFTDLGDYTPLHQRNERGDHALTADGVVKLKHWDAVISMDNCKGYHLKACPKLSVDHVHPKPYQKMNVVKAFQFFGRSVAAGVVAYKPHHPDLHDCHASVAVIERVKSLIMAMNSRFPGRALRKESEEWRAIEELMEYLEEWEAEATNKGYYFMSSSTCLGLKVTLRATLEIHRFLETNYGYQ